MRGGFLSAIEIFQQSCFLPFGNSRELSRTEDLLEGDPGLTGATISTKTDSAFTSAATGSHTSVTERLSRNTYSGMGSTMVKNRRAQSCGKDAKRKSQKATFSLCLEIPHTPRDSHFPTSFGCCCIHDEQLQLWNKRGHFYCNERGDISKALRQAAMVALLVAN